MDALLDLYQVSLEAGGKSRTTVKTYMTAVRQLAAYFGERDLDWHEISPLDCQAWPSG